MFDVMYKVPYIEINVDGDVDDDFVSKVKNVVMKIRPDWNLGNFNCQRINDGFTNTTFICQIDHKTCELESETDTSNIQGVPKNSNSENETQTSIGNNALVVRIYGKGTDAFINRNRELLAMNCLKCMECIPKLMAVFTNGFVYGFVPGRSLVETDLQDWEIQRLVIKELVKFHSVDIVSLQKEFCKNNNLIFSDQPELFDKMKKWIDFLSDIKNVNWTKDKLLNEIDHLFNELMPYKPRVVFCHNDLLPNNIIYYPEQRKVYIIDLEYCQPNYLAFDIATYFCEFAGMKDIDFNLYPSKDYQLKWLRIYLEDFNQLNKNKFEIITDDDVETFYVEVNRFALVSHLYWAVWGLMQNQLSTIDYDYLTFSGERLKEYERRKTEFMNLKMP